MAVAFESITPSAKDATDRLVVRRGAGPLDHTMELIDPAEVGATNLSYDAATRTIASDTGTDAVLPLVDNTNPGLSSAPKRGPQRLYAFTDMFSVSNTEDWAVTASGGAWAFAEPQDGGVGWGRMSLGTSATARAAYHCPALQSIQLNAGKCDFAVRLRLNQLSDATDDYSFRAGFIDNAAAESTDGAFFRYNHAVASGNWQAVTRSNGVETAVDTGIAAATGTTFKLEVDVNAGATSIEFRINGAVAATITTNIPTGSGRETGYGIYGQRSAGTATLFAMFIDYIMATQAQASR